MKCPCKDCRDRWVTDSNRCHSSCNAYAEWRKSVNVINRRRVDSKTCDDVIGSVLFGRKSK